jgi:peptidoglycan/LPS O-acetylase OafA/YrhL
MSNRIAALDGWRAISVGFVIIDHLMQFSAVSLPAHEAWFSRLGNLGVSIFFVISGYVICRGLTQESRLYGRISITAFYTRRFFRIVPPLTVYICTVFILSLTGIVSTDQAIFRALTFSCDLPKANCGGYVGAHTWSLSVEEQFYLAAPFLFAIAQPKRVAVTVSVIAGAALMVIAMTALGNDEGAIFIANFLPISVGV